ncbi:MAG TPA: ROK family protein [Trebonia sp.]
MSKRAVIALDVGGTTVDTACVSADGEVIGGVLDTSSPAAGTKDDIVNELARVIDTVRARADGAEVTACGVAMPGPFDYVAGVSYMVHKFEAIHGLSLGTLLEAKTGLPAYFVNDADAFGLGVSWRQLPDTKRFVALTIGTGLGGSFIEDGENVQTGDRVPPGGEVWNLPFRDGILEDQVSARGVVAMYGGLRPGDRRSAKEVSGLAQRDDPPAMEAYRAMGAALGSGLASSLARFAPEKIVIGGKVGQSLELFRPAMEQALAAAGLPELPVIPAAPGNMAIWGAARYPLALGAV